MRFTPIHLLRCHLFDHQYFDMCFQIELADLGFHFVFLTFDYFI